MKIRVDLDLIKIQATSQQMQDITDSMRESETEARFIENGSIYPRSKPKNQTLVIGAWTVEFDIHRRGLDV